jgi:hypothetical protein
MQIIKQNQELATLPKNSLSRLLLNAMAVGSTGEVHNQMCRYKEKGEPNHLSVMQNIPKDQRLPQIAKIYGNDKIATVLGKQITRTLTNFNLRVGMNTEQIYDLSLALIETAEEDNLAIEDIMLFLDGLPKFKYGKVYDRMDMPTFFEMLEVYREQRHQAYVNAKEEAHAQYKSMGDTNRMSNDTDKEANRNAMNEYLKNQYK